MSERYREGAMVSPDFSSLKVIDSVSVRRARVNAT